MSSQAGAQSGATRFSSLIRKITGSAVLWSWGMNGIRLGFGRYTTEEEIIDAEFGGGGSASGCGIIFGD